MMAASTTVKKSIEEPPNAQKQTELELKVMPPNLPENSRASSRAGSHAGIAPITTTTAGKSRRFERFFRSKQNRRQTSQRNIDFCYFLPPQKRHLLTDSEFRDYETVFSLLDPERNGRVGVTELSEAMTRMDIATSDTELNNIIAEVDQDGNGVIDFEEFCDVMRRLSSNMSWHDAIDQCWHVFERSGSEEAITFSDFRYVLCELGDIKDIRLIEHLFSEHDINGSGLIDKDEFANFVKSYLKDEDLGNM